MTKINGICNEYFKSVKDAFVKNFEEGLEAFYRYQKLTDYKLMMKSAVRLSEVYNKKRKYLIELTAKCALENNDIDFAWKAALYAGRLSN